MALFLAGGCPGDPRINVQLCGDWAVPDDLQAVRVSTFDADRNRETFEGVFELVKCSGGQTVTQTLPAVLPFTSPDAPLWLLVQGLRDGAVVTQVEVRVGQAFEGEITVPVRFTRSCGGVTCPLGQTCVDGRCIVTPFFETDPMSCADFGAAPAPDVISPIDGGGSDTIGDAGPSGPCAP